MKLRSAIFFIHLITGCMTGVVIFFLAATGFLLAWQKPIMVWQERGYHSAPPQNQAAPVPLDRLIGIAAAKDHKGPTFATIDSDDSSPLEVDFGGGQHLFLNRYSGTVLGPGAARTQAFFYAVTALHRWFGTPLSDHTSAKRVKGAFTFALLLMIVTGIWLWIPRAWSWPRVKTGVLLRFGLAGRARDWNRHITVGFWAALPLAVIALTGVILAYGWMTHFLYVVTGTPEPVKVHSAARKHRPDKKHKKAEMSDPSGISIQQVFDETRLQAPGWHRIRIAFPHSTDRTIECFIDFGNGSRPDEQARIIFDRRSGAIITRTTFASYSRGQQIRSFLKYIHTGEAGGLAGETLAGLTALACCILVWTGFAMAVRRLQSLRSASRRREKIAATAVEPVASTHYTNK